MIIAFDTHYYEGKAKTVCLGFENWPDTEPGLIRSEILETTAEYIPGSFFERELPCIMSLLNKIELPAIRTIIIDGFVILDDTGKLGLGGHLYERLNKTIPVIGVAKTNFLANTINKQELFRTESKRPLYISSLGTDLDTATANIRSMSGNYRIPDLLKTLDRLTKDLSQ